MGHISTKKCASAGNRTRAARVAGEHSTTEPPMLTLEPLLSLNLRVSITLTKCQVKCIIEHYHMKRQNILPTWGSNPRPRD